MVIHMLKGKFILLFDDLTDADGELLVAGIGVTFPHLFWLLMNFQVHFNLSRNGDIVNRDNNCFQL